VLPAVLAIGALLIAVVAWSLMRRGDTAAKHEAVEWHAPADTHKETTGLIASVKKEVNHVAPVTVFKVAEPQPSVSPTPSQQELQRLQAAEERRAKVYASGQLVSVTHASNTLELGSHEGDLHGGIELPTSGNGAGSHQVRLQGPEPTFTIMQGKTLRAQLLDDIDTSISDIPIEAQILEPVYDSLTSKSILLPAGSKLLGKYATNVGTEQSSVRVEWSRITLPDTSSFDVPPMVAAVSDEVDRHYLKRFALATVLGLISAGGSVAGTMTYGSGASGAYPNGQDMAKQQFIQGMSQQVGAQGQSMVQQDMNTPTTLKIRKGTPIEVKAWADLVFPKPYGG
jgi:type IV secretory pathway VirB10-like protein